MYINIKTQNVISLNLWVDFSFVEFDRREFCGLFVRTDTVLFGDLFNIGFVTFIDRGVKRLGVEFTFVFFNLVQKQLLDRIGNVSHQHRRRRNVTPNESTGRSGDVQLLQQTERQHVWSEKFIVPSIRVLNEYCT